MPPIGTMNFRGGSITFTAADGRVIELPVTNVEMSGVVAPVNRHLPAGFVSLLARYASPSRRPDGPRVTRPAGHVPNRSKWCVAL